MASSRLENVLAHEMSDLLLKTKVPVFTDGTRTTTAKLWRKLQILV
jgi:hypothetical protein